MAVETLHDEAEVPGGVDGLASASHFLGDECTDDLRVDAQGSGDLHSVRVRQRLVVHLAVLRDDPIHREE